MLSRGKFLIITLSFLAFFFFLSHVLADKSADVQTEDSFYLLFLSGDMQEANDVVKSSLISEIVAQERGMEEKPGSGACTPRVDMLLWLGDASNADVSHSDNGVNSKLKAVSPAVQRSEVTPSVSRYVDMENEGDEDGGTEKAFYDAVESESVEKSGSPDPTEICLKDGNSFTPFFAYSDFTPNAENVLLNKKEITSSTSPQRRYYFKTFPVSPSSLLSSVFVNKMCIISLDISSSRSPPSNLAETLFHPSSSTPPNYHHLTSWANKEGVGRKEDDLLGEEQWRWLENILSTFFSPSTRGSDGNFSQTAPDNKHKRGRVATVKGDHENDENGDRDLCAVTIISSAWQILLNDNKPLYGWDWYSASRSRLLHLLQKYQASRFIFVSGHSRGIAELGEVVRASPEKVLTQNKAIRLYAAKVPFRTSTNYSAELLPLHSSIVEVSTSFSSPERFTVSVPAPFRAFLHYFYPRAIRPTFVESESPVNFFPRYLSLYRTARSESSVGTLQMKQAGLVNPDKWKQMSTVEKKKTIMEIFNVTITLHFLPDQFKSGKTSESQNNVETVERLSNSIKENIVYSSSLASLPSYAVDVALKDRSSPLSTVDDLLSLNFHTFPHFVVYNTPTEYPLLKRSAVFFHCPDFECLGILTFQKQKVTLLVLLLLLVVFSALFLLLPAQIRKWRKKKKIL